MLEVIKENSNPHPRPRHPVELNHAMASMWLSFLLTRLPSPELEAKWLSSLAHALTRITMLARQSMVWKKQLATSISYVGIDYAELGALARD